MTFNEACECWVTPEYTWTKHYGAVEPGSQWEPNPECPVHFPPGGESDLPEWYGNFCMSCNHPHPEGECSMNHDAELRW